MMAKQLDAIIFGATGFTGQIVVRNAIDIFKDFKWGIAGRSKSKLENILEEVGKKTGKDLSKVPIIIADANDETSINSMAKMCKVVLNCCGPYLFYGEKVVKACVEVGTHHVDISGEPQYIDAIQLKYNDLAEKTGSYVVPSCAFESIAAEMGVVFAERNFNGTLNSVEMFWENNFQRKDKHSKALLHYGTWESAINAMANPYQLFSQQKKLRRDKPAFAKPKLRINPFPQKPSFTRNYFIPFPATDRDLVQRSQSLRYSFEKKRPVQFEAYIGFQSLILALLVPVYLFILVLMAQLGCTRYLLLKYPHIFSFGMQTRDGPTEANADGHDFNLTFRARGWAREQNLKEKPSQEMLTRVSGCNPFYGFTSIALLFAAKTLLMETSKLPGSGGVMPPGAAFAKTNLIKELSQPKNGAKFEIIH